jgi:hypothetical protein
MRYIYSKCRCCWNVATYKWKVHNVKLKSFVLTRPSLIISRCMSRYEANLAVSVVFQAQWDRWDKEITTFGIHRSLLTCYLSLCAAYYKLSFKEGGIPETWGRYLRLIHWIICILFILFDWLYPNIRETISHFHTLINIKMELIWTR